MNLLKNSVMNKITKIELEDIRIYRDKEEFNFFYNETEVANLIAIYGPNGFGKSSFFDACEWAMSGKIQRFEKDKESQELLNQHDLILDDKVFLNNRNSYRIKKDFTGNVKFYINDQVKPTGRTIKGRAKRGQGYNEDYKIGAFFGENEDIFNKTSENKILSQTMIDAFLRSDTPEKRFEIVSAMIPKLNQSVAQYNKLKNYFQEIKKENESVEKTINDLNENKKELLKDFPNLDKINSLILSYNKFELFNSELKSITAEISQSEYNDLSTSIDRNKIQIEEQLEKIEKVLTDLNSLITQFTDCETWNKRHDEIILEIASVNKIIKLYIDSKEHEKKITLLESEITKVKSVLKDYTELQQLQSSYLEFTKKIKQNHDSEGKEHERINRYNRSLSDISETLAELNNSKQNLIIEKEYFDEQVSIHKFKIKRREAIRLEQDTLKKEKEASIKKVEFLKKNIEEFQLRKNLNEKIYKEFSTTDNYQVPENVQTLIDKRYQFVKEIQETNKEIENKEQEYKKAGDLNENLSRIITWGQDIIKKTKTSNCPLCNSHYNNFEELLTHVNSEKEDTLNLLEKSNLIDKLKIQVNEAEENQKDIENKIREIISTEINTLNTTIIELKENKDKTENFVHDKIKSIERNSNELEEIYDFLEKYISNLPYEEDEHGKKSGQLPDLIKKIAELEQEIKEAEIEKIDLATSIEKSKKVIFDLKNQTQQIEKEVVFIKTSTLLKKYESENIYENDTKLAELINEKKDNISQIQTDIDSHRTNNDIIKLELDAKKDIGQEHELQGILQEKDTEKNIFKDKIADYQKNFKNLTGKQEYIYSNLEIELENQKKSKAKFEDAQTVAEDLAIEVKVLSNAVKLNEINLNLDKEAVRLNKSQNTFVKFEKAVNDCQNVIKHVVDKQLNKTTINNIYKRIEPHPELNEIDFQVYFSDREKPLLKIISKSSKEEVDPTLFLSSGQINILSLSIFLAKALHDKEGLDTIFMDDPIQNLSDINILSFIDLLRTLISNGDKQIIISTHDEHFLNLLKNKLPENHYKTKYLELVSYGKLRKKAPIEM